MHQWVQEEWKWKYSIRKWIGCSKSNSKGEIHSNKCLPQETGKTQIILYLKELEKEGETKPKVRRRNEITKIRVEIHGIQTKKTTEMINKIQSWKLALWKDKKIDKLSVSLRVKIKK